jgi:hypothetical protein
MEYQTVLQKPQRVFMRHTVEVSEFVDSPHPDEWRVRWAWNAGGDNTAVVTGTGVTIDEARAFAEERFNKVAGNDGSNQV